MVDKEIIGQVPKSIKNLRKLNKILNIILCIIIIPIVFVNMTILIKSLINKDTVPDFLGYKFFVVLTGSMQDTLKPGDFIISKKIDTSSLQIGDIISFKEDNTIITHRIIKIEKKDGELLFTTKGDYNNTEDDNKVEKSNIEGKYILKIPGIGKILIFFQSILGIIILIMIPVLSIILSLRREEKINMKKAIRKSKRITYNQSKKK